MKLQIDAALSFGSTSTETPENVNEAKLRKKLREQHEKASNNAEYSLDDHIIDYELRRVKERRAHEEILSGRYRQPAFIARKYGTLTYICIVYFIMKLNSYKFLSSFRITFFLFFFFFFNRSKFA
jgi:hypothetical protein